MACQLPPGINFGAGFSIPSAFLDVGTATVRERRRRARKDPVPYSGTDETPSAAEYPFFRYDSGPLDNSGYDPTGLPHRVVVPFGKSVHVRMKDPNMFHPRELRHFVARGSNRIEVENGSMSSIIITGKDIGRARLVAIDESGTGRGELDIFVKQPIARRVGVSLAHNVDGTGRKINVSARRAHEIGPMFRAANKILYPQSGLYFYDAHAFRGFADRQLELGFGLSEGLRDVDIDAVALALDWNVDINVVLVHKLKLPFLNSNDTVAAASILPDGRRLIILSDQTNLLDGSTFAHEICHTLTDPALNAFTGYGTTGANRNHSSNPEDLMSPSSHAGGKLTGTRIRWEESVTLNPAGVWSGSGGLAGLRSALS